jgi:hypothetical protein
MSIGKIVPPLFKTHENGADAEKTLLTGVAEASYSVAAVTSREGATWLRSWIVTVQARRGIGELWHIRHLFTFGCH